jgi:anti-anti-sigma factor
MLLTWWLPRTLHRLLGIADAAACTLPEQENGARRRPAHWQPEKRPEPVLRMDVEARETKEGVVVLLRGEAGIAESRLLQTFLTRLTARRLPRVTFDLSGLLSLSSLAMGVLTGYRHAAVRLGARVCLTPDLTPAVREALERAELMDNFEVAASGPSSVEAGASAHGARPSSPEVPERDRSGEITWSVLVDLEPQVQELLFRARQTGARCRNVTDVDQIFCSVRNDLAELIGFSGKHHRHPVLGSARAYGVACLKLYEAVAGLLPRPAGIEEAPGEPMPLVPAEAPQKSPQWTTATVHSDSACLNLAQQRIGA